MYRYLCFVLTGTVVVLLYCIAPILSSTVLLFGVNKPRVEESVPVIKAYVKKVRVGEKLDHLRETFEHDEIKAGLLNVLENEKAIGAPTIRELVVFKPVSPTPTSFKKKEVASVTDVATDTVECTIYKIWVANALFIAFLSCLPFLIMGISLGFDIGYESFRARAPQDSGKYHGHGLAASSSLAGREASPPTPGNRTIPPRRLILAALDRFPTKLLVATASTWGWLYFFYPLGQGATSLQSFMKMVDIASKDSLPFVVGYHEMPHTVAGFLGWYTYLIYYFLYRVYYRDSLSSSIFSVLFRQLLLVYGLSLVLSALQVDGSVLLAFLVGLLPQSALSTLKEYGLKGLSGAAKLQLSLSNLEGISHWEVIRLEEEGIDSIPSLALAPVEQIRNEIPRLSHIDLWSDSAKLITVIGLDTYEKAKKYCRTATEFVRLVEMNSPLLKELRGECEIANPDEISRILQSHYPGLTLDVPDRSLSA